MIANRQFAEKFEAERYTVFSTPHWTVLLRKGQVTLGALVLAANRQFVSGGELTAAEATEYPQVVGRLERMLASALQFDKINYLLLMMVDEHYHYHVIPRYASLRTFAGRPWSDDAWPGPPALSVLPTDADTLDRLRDWLRSHDSQNSTTV